LESSRSFYQYKRTLHQITMQSQKQHVNVGIACSKYT